MEKLSKYISSAAISQQEKDDKSKDKRCVICQEKATSTCSACRSVGYCCTEHQKLDWKNHKNSCHAFSIKQTENMGLGWFATRNLPAGFILLEESPVVQSPAWKFVTLFSEGRKCLCCGVQIKSTRTCSTCLWPVCSKKCEKNPVHSDNECKEFVSRKLKYRKSPYHIGLLIMFIRAYALKARDPQKFQQLMALQDYYSDPSLNQELQNCSPPPELFHVLGGPRRLDLREFQKLYRILMLNGMDFKFTPSDAPKPSPAFKCLGDGVEDEIMAVYLKTPRVNHSCSPNCTIAFGSAPANRIRIFTSVPVVKGQQLFINIIDWCCPAPTADRQPSIQQAGFICKCKRCLDPTELGSFLSGIKCFNCSNHLKADSESDNVGFLLPSNPLDIKSLDPTYECHRCHVNVPYSIVLGKILPWVVRDAFLNCKKLTNVDNPRDLDFKAFEIHLNQLEEVQDFKDHLHKNHWLIHDATRLIIEVRRLGLDKMTKQDLKKRIRRIKYLLSVDEKLFPGFFIRKYQDVGALKETIELLLAKFGSELPSKEVEELRQELQSAEAEKLQFDSLLKFS